MAPPNAPESQIELTRHQLGLDKPLVDAVRHFLGDAVHGDFGDSYYWHQSAGGLVFGTHLAGATLALAARPFRHRHRRPVGLVAATSKGGSSTRG